METIFFFMRSLILSIPFVLICNLGFGQDILQIALASNSPKIEKVTNNLQQYNLQILLTTITKNGDSVSFTDYSFQVNDSSYYYPASTVKFPIAVLAIEKINSIESIDLETPYVIDGDSIEHSIFNDIKNIFAISSNEAFNRLFEFLGKEHINQRLRELEVGPVKIEHRLSTSNSADTIYKSLHFKPKKGDEYLVKNENSRPVKPLQMDGLLNGKAYYSDTLLVEEPMDFSKKNYLPLQTLHNIMKRVIYPSTFKTDKQFKITDNQYKTLIKLMQNLPRDAGFDERKFHDSFGKFFLFGDSKETMPRSIKIYNKVGYAYGTLTDCSFIKDFGQDIEYILSATLYVNQNGILNDNQYDYDEIGIPFLAQLGREIHEYLTTHK